MKRFLAPFLASNPQRQHRLVNFAVSAYFHLLFPASLGRAPADRSVDEPAKVSGIELPCRAILPVLRWTAARQPAGLGLLGGAALECQKKQDLALDIHRNVPPALLEALNGLGRNTQNLCHLVLSFSEMPTDCRKLESHHFPAYPPFDCIVYHCVGQEGTALPCRHSKISKNIP